MKLTLGETGRHTQALDDFIAAHPDATLGHNPRWISVMRDGLRHRDLSIIAWRDSAVVGYLPLVETSSVLFGRHLVSLPYVNEAGVLAESESVAARLIEHAGELTRQRRARFMELRHRVATERPGLIPVRTEKVRMTRPLPEQAEALFAVIPSKVRNQVRKGQANNLSVRFGGAELLADFYRVFAVNMRDLGTPVFPRRLFGAMLHHLGGAAELCVVSHEGRAIAAALIVHGPGVTEVPSASSLRAYNHTSANMLMYYHLLERAVGRGSRTFDFGRSTLDSGTFNFKKQWGATPEPTGWQHLPLTAGARPITQTDARFARATEIWKRLPVWLTRVVGPTIVRGIP